MTHFYGTDGQDTLTGTSKHEAFWGGQGDLMTGGGGDDTYYVRSRLDQIMEVSGGGADRIYAWMNADLAKHGQGQRRAISST